MFTVYDMVWRSLVAAAAPVWLAVPKARRKVLKAFRERSARDVPAAPADAPPCVLIHAVALGEINATRVLVDQLVAARPGLRICVTVTTDTGFARGRELYGANPAVTLVRFPLDFTGPVARLLDRQRPAVAVLMELEVWPNFVLHCARRGIPVVLVNGRLTESSFRQYRLGGPLVRRMFARLAAVCAQDQAYADRFAALGARPDTLSVTGTMKFDTAEPADRVAGDADLARAVGLPPPGGPAGGRAGAGGGSSGEPPPGGPTWVCGSTGPGEEAIALAAYRALLPTHPDLRLVLVPRHPQRFDEVATLIADAGFNAVRRSATKRQDETSGAPDARNHLNPPLAASPIKAGPPSSPTSSSAPAPRHPDTPTPRHPAPAVVLGDTMGELRAFYSLADVVLVGRTLVDLGPRQRGSDMIEPAALAKPVVVGPWTQNFADAVRQLRQAGGLATIDPPAGTPVDALAVAAAVRRLLADRPAAAAMGRRAQAVVRGQQGATARHVAVILARLEHCA